MNRGKTSVRRALSLSFTRTGINFVFNVATVTIVSRLLTPAEVGVFSVAVALVALIQMLRDFGVSDFIVQERDLSKDLVRTAFTVNLIIGLVLAAAVFGLSNLIGKFYGHPGVADVARVLSLVFVLMPFGATTQSYMRREMQFGLLVRIQTAETAARSITTIVLAYLGFSYMSMAWASVAAMSTAVIGCVVWGGEYRIGGFGLTDWRRVLHFGSNRTIADIAAEVGRQSADIVVGRMLGMAAAGFYSRGYGVVNIFRVNFVRAVAAVAFPAYAREHREGNEAPRLFSKSVVYLTGVAWPFFSFAALMAYPLIRLAFGSQWIPAVPLMRWLCCAAIVGALIYQVNGLLTATGNYREVTRIEVQYQLVRVALAVLAALYSLEAVAASQILVYVVAVALYYRKLVQYDALRPRVLITSLAPSAALAVVSSIVPVAVLVLWPGSPTRHYISEFLVAAGGAGVSWVAGIFLLKHPLSLEITNVVTVLRQYVRASLRFN